MEETQAKNYIELIKEATEIFQKSYPGAILYTATGRPVAGVAKSEDELTEWSYKALTDKQTAQLEYSDGKFGQPRIIGPWFGLQFVQLPQGTIRLRKAIEILNDNGYTQGFMNVALGTPVVPDPQPMFWFCVDRETQGVSASTGDFFPNLFPCTPGEGAGSPKE